MWLYVSTKNVENKAAVQLRQKSKNRNFSINELTTDKDTTKLSGCFYIKDVYDFSVILHGVDRNGNPLKPFVAIHTMRKARDTEQGMEFCGHKNVLTEDVYLDLEDLDVLNILYPDGAFGV